jgi:peroxiredoxin
MRFPRMSGNAWVCTIITLILLLSGTEQAIRALSNRPVRDPTPPPSAMDLGPKLGDELPNFTAPDEGGKQYTLAQFRGKPLIVNFFCGCSRCMGIGRMLAQWQKKEKAPMIGLVTFKPDFFAEFRKETGITFPLLLDPEKEIGLQWNSPICPRIWVVDAKGRAVFTNPHEPEMMPPQQTAAMVVQAYKNPVVPKPPKPQVAKAPEAKG